MKYFYTFVTETLTRPVVVKAENQEEAEQKVIDASDFVDVNFETQDSDAVDRMSEEDKQRLTYVK